MVMMMTSPRMAKMRLPQLVLDFLRLLKLLPPVYVDIQPLPAR